MFLFWGKGLREFGETFASSLTGQRPLTATVGASAQGPQPGVVTVIDLDGVAKGQVIDSHIYLLIILEVINFKKVNK